MPAIEFEYPAGNVVEEVAIVSHRNNRAWIFIQKTLQPGDDLVFKYGTNAPTLRVESMTVAGA